MAGSTRRPRLSAPHLSAFLMTAHLAHPTGPSLHALHLCIHFILLIDLDRREPRARQRARFSPRVYVPSVGKKGFAGNAAAAAIGRAGGKEGGGMKY